MQNNRIYTMTFASVYPLYLAKIERKGRSKQELDQVIVWLTGYSLAELKEQIDLEITFEKFFADAPALNPRRKLITGLICGIRVEEIEEPLMQEIRYMDKLVDELAKGKVLSKILR